MPDTDPTYGWPIPILGDSPADLLDVAPLAAAIAATIHGVLVEQLPVFDDSHSSHITGADVRCGQSATQDLLTATFTLTRTQVVLVGGKARFQADATSSARGYVGLIVLVDGAFDADHAMAGPVPVEQSGAIGAAIQVSIPIWPVILAAGSHTVKLQADRDGTGVINATGTTTGIGTSSRTYTPTSLTVVV